MHSKERMGVRSDGAVHKGGGRGSGVAAGGSMLVGAPYIAPGVLVVDTLGGVVRGNSTDAVDKERERRGSSERKWRGIAALGSKLFAAPHVALVLLVVSRGRKRRTRRIDWRSQWVWMIFQS